MYLLQRRGVSAMVLLQVVDSPLAPAGPLEGNGYQSGIFFLDGQPKPSRTAFSFPFVTERRSGAQIVAWSIPPRTGRLAIQRRSGGGWRTVKRTQVRGGRPFQTTLALRGAGTFRAQIGGATSLAWTQKRAGGGSGQRGPGARASAGRSAALLPYTEATAD